MDKSRVKALVITGFGLNCERETAAGFQAAGASAEKVHLNDLLDGTASSTGCATPWRRT